MRSVRQPVSRFDIKRQVSRSTGAGWKRRACRHFLSMRSSKKRWNGFVTPSRVLNSGRTSCLASSQQPSRNSPDAMQRSLPVQPLEVTVGLPDCPSHVLLRRATLDDVGSILACLHAAFEPYKADYTAAAFEDTVLTRERLQARLQTMSIFVATTELGEI